MELQQSTLVAGMGEMRHAYRMLS